MRILGPAIGALGAADLLVAERRAVCAMRTGLGRRTPGDRAVHQDEGRARGLGARVADRRHHRLGVVRVHHLERVPAVTLEPVEHVLAKGQVGRAFDRDLVAVVDPGEIAQAQMPGNGCRLAREALHHVAIAGQRVDMVVEHREVRLVVACRKELLGHRHADRIAATLPERTSGRLHARGPPILRMTRRFAIELPEQLQVVDRQRRPAAVLALVDRPDPRQVDQAVKQHRRVPDRQHEAVAVRPVRIVRVEVHEALPDRVGDRRERHRCARMPGIRLLHRIHRERADRVDAELVDICTSAGVHALGARGCFDRSHHRSSLLLNHEHDVQRSKARPGTQVLRARTRHRAAIQLPRNAFSAGGATGWPSTLRHVDVNERGTPIVASHQFVTGSRGCAANHATASYNHLTPAPRLAISSTDVAYFHRRGGEFV